MPSASDAFRTTLDLFSTGVDLMRQNLRRDHPDADDDEIDAVIEREAIGRLATVRLTLSSEPRSPVVDASELNSLMPSTA